MALKLEIKGLRSFFLSLEFTNINAQPGSSSKKAILEVAENTEILKFIENSLKALAWGIDSFMQQSQSFSRTISSKTGNHVYTPSMLFPHILTLVTLP